MRGWFLVVAAAVLLLGLTDGASASDRTDCLKTGDSDTTIGACTRLLDSGVRGGDRALILVHRAVAYSSRGVARAKAKDLDSGLADLNWSLADLDVAVASSDIPTYRRARGVTLRARAIVYSRKGDYDRAIADLDEAIRVEPKSAILHEESGDAYRKKGDASRAAAAYDRALQLNPKNSRLAERKQEVLDKLAATTSSPSPAAAAPTPRPEAPLAAIAPAGGGGKRVALVIGNGDYRKVGTLANPKKDAAAVAASLRSVGFEVLDRYDLDERAMRSALSDFEGRATGADWALVYYAGHGMEMDGRNWLVPVDAELDRSTDVPDETIELDRVLDRVRPAKRLRIVILDACRNNPFVPRMAMTGGRTRAIQRGLADIEPEHGEVVFYAARHGTTADDGSTEHSPFTNALLKHLNEEGLEIGLFFRKVTSAVLASTNPKQEPFVYGRIPADNFYFVPPR